MPKIRTSKSKRPPEGFEDIEDTLLDFDTKLKDGMFFFFTFFSLQLFLTNIYLLFFNSFSLSFSRNKNKRHICFSTCFFIAVSMANLPATPPTVTLHLRPVLQEKGYQCRAVRVAPTEPVRGREPDCQVEKARIRKPVLSQVYTG